MATLRLIVEVTYDESEELTDDLLRELADNLLDLPARAASDGALTGDTPATVDTWNAKVEQIVLS